MKTRKILNKLGYSVEINYSPESIKNKTMKFITKKSGDEFEINADELSSMLIGGVNSETLEATFVDSQRIDVVEVGRQLQCVLDKDMKKGEKININYVHPYPLQFALIEEIYKIAKIDEKVSRIELTKEYMDEVRKKLQPNQTEFLNKFYKSFKNIKI